MTDRLLSSYPWRISYRSSSVREDGTPVDILHDFYIPALQRSVKYDRVAGYFRSTSLAAASQGFSAFVANRGKIRLIVGGDLEPDDVAAILGGDQQRLERLLQGELEGDGDWPAEVVRGVQLLAWMVANGHLEVKVALRVHNTTGQPLPFDSVEDGYVHEKWAILTDKNGDSLYVSGSLNESKTALTINAENIEVHCSWQGNTDLQRVQQAQADFERLWKNLHPGIKVLKIPDAVQQRLISFATSFETIGRNPLQEIDGSTQTKPKIEPPSARELLSFNLLKDGPRLPGGRYVGMETAPITPWPHQAVVARRLIDSWPYSYLLCDEVGLGKTIEAGLAIRSLYLSGIAKRVLIAAPASLTRQWQREMATKFLLPFGRGLASPGIRHEYLLPLEHDKSNRSLFEPDLAIVSTGLMSRKDRHPDLRQCSTFDIALVDESHYARRSNSTQGSKVSPKFGNLYKTIQDVLRGNARSLWLATATPMQLHQVEVSDLVALTNRVGAFQYDPTLMSAYYELLGKLVSGVELTDPEWLFLRRSVQAVEIQDPIQWKYITSAVIDGASRIDVQRWLNQGTIPRGRGKSGVIRLIFAASPLSRVMLRHTRSLLEIYREEGKLGANLAKRIILPVPTITFTPEEKLVYDQFQAYCEGLAARMARDTNRRNMSAVGFMLSFLRLRFASSLFAINETMRRRQATVERTIRVFEQHGIPDDVPLDENELAELLDESGDDDQIVVEALLKNRTLADLQWELEQVTELRRLLDNLTGTPSKTAELLRVLQQRRKSGGRIKQTVIFTRFFDTLTDILNRLRQADPNMQIGTYSGRGGSYYSSVNHQMVSVERDEIKHRFLRGEIDVLLCTDAAAEGLNLQSADLLINYDLPWNPMKVEQRIGRIDRIGQRYETIYVLNLCYVDSAEHIVYGRLLARLMQAGAVVGTQQVSLLPVTREEFQELAEGRLPERELESRARQRCEEMQRRTRSMEITPQELYSIYCRQAEQVSQVNIPVTMESIWDTISESLFLRDKGCIVLPDSEHKTIVLASVPDVANGTMLTASREIFDQGLPNNEISPRFASYGEPAFDRLLDMVTNFDLPPCIRRISTVLPGSSMELVGYAVAGFDATGAECCSLVTSLSDVNNIRLNEAGVVSDEDVSRLEQELISRESPVLPTDRIEAINTQAARRQLKLDYLVINGLLTSRKHIGQGEPLFWREITAVEAIGEETCGREGSLRIPRINAAVASRMRHDLLFDVSVPTVGQDGYMDAPLPLVRAAVESAMRLADSMKEARGSFLTDSFLVRLEREIQRSV